jgi:RND family efflux transporter MFP subunit
LASAGGSETPPLRAVPVRAATGGDATGFDGVIEAVRHTVVAAQVAGAVTALHVKAGERVRAGQLLVRIDARAAEHTAAAGDAQVQSARASLDLARKELARQQQLFDKHYISQAALDRAQAQFKATEAQANALLAQAGAARTQSGLHIVKAPYDGIVAGVPVQLGDMALPGTPLVRLYDPTALRVSVALPQSMAASALKPGAALRVELPGRTGDARWSQPVRSELLPTLDPGTHTATLRLALPAELDGVAPGEFARVWLPASGAAGDRLHVPISSLVRRAEMTAVYVLGKNGEPLLRQVRLGRTSGDSVEVLAGVSAGEQVLVEPQAAARRR